MLREMVVKRPTRVMINAQGEAVSPMTAYREYGYTQTVTHLPRLRGGRTLHHKTVDIVFIRKDGWTLGAPSEFEDIAYRTWPDEWLGFVRTGRKAQPVSEYVPRGGASATQ